MALVCKETGAAGKSLPSVLFSFAGSAGFGLRQRAHLFGCVDSMTNKSSLARESKAEETVWENMRRCMPWLRMKRTGRKENESVRVGTAISSLYDALGYAAQVSEIADGHVKDGEDFSRDQLRELWEKALN